MIWPPQQEAALNAVAEWLKQGEPQLLVGLNRSRRSYNQRMRELIGRTSAFPEAGDKIVCLKNNNAKGLLNGGIWIVKSTAKTRKKKLLMNVISEDDPAAKPLRIGVLPEFFQGLEETLPPLVRRDSDEFDYGYALTVHKAQGSQWQHVILFGDRYHAGIDLFALDDLAVAIRAEIKAFSLADEHRQSENGIVRCLPMHLGQHHIRGCSGEKSATAAVGSIPALRVPQNS